MHFFFHPSADVSIADLDLKKVTDFRLNQPGTTDDADVARLMAGDKLNAAKGPIPMAGLWQTHTQTATTTTTTIRRG